MFVYICVLMNIILRVCFLILKGFIIFVSLLYFKDVFFNKNFEFVIKWIYKDCKYYNYGMIKWIYMNKMINLK